MTDSNAPPVSSTTVATSGGAVAIDLRDAQAIAVSLRQFLETDPSAKSVPMLDPGSAAWLRPGDAPFIDREGRVRIGLWLLQARGDDLVLVWREPGAVGYQYVASVVREASGRWRVAAAAWEKLLAR